ncbi:MAG: glutaredoxin [Eubacteriaceae bacterium]|nr:glutaredoxin [Eubacteriaceae bacterium]
MSEVIIYTWSYCSFCNYAKKLLSSKNISFTEINIDNDDDTFQEQALKTGHRTVPFIFIGGKFIGGYTDLKALNDSGKLDLMLQE